jgi:hypothetical protein
VCQQSIFLLSPLFPINKNYGYQPCFSKSGDVGSHEQSELAKQSGLVNHQKAYLFSVQSKNLTV